MLVRGWGAGSSTWASGRGQGGKRWGQTYQQRHPRSVCCRCRAARDLINGEDGGEPGDAKKRDVPGPLGPGVVSGDGKRGGRAGLPWTTPAARSWPVLPGARLDGGGRGRAIGAYKKIETFWACGGPASSAGAGRRRAGVGSPWPALSARPAAVWDGVGCDGEREGQGRRGVGEEEEKSGLLGPGIVSRRERGTGGGPDAGGD